MIQFHLQPCRGFDIETPPTEQECLEIFKRLLFHSQNRIDVTVNIDQREKYLEYCIHLYSTVPNPPFSLIFLIVRRGGNTSVVINE